MDRKGVTMMGLSKMLGYSSKNSVNTILHGYGKGSGRPPNTIKFDEVEMWCDALNLTAEQAERLREDVNLDHCEEWFRKRYWELKEQAVAKRSSRS